MNKVNLVGRMVRDPEIRYTVGENAMATARFSVAINRKFKNADGNYDADFINCVAFSKCAEFVEKYFKKGMPIGISGRIQTGSYTNKDGNKVYTTDVIADEVEFVESKGSSDAISAPKPTYDPTNIPDNVDDELPFN